MAKQNVSQWVREWATMNSPKEASEVIKIMRRSGIPDNKITLALEAWMAENPASGEAAAPEKMTLEKLVALMDRPEELKAAWARLSDEEKAELTQQMKALAPATEPGAAPTPNKPGSSTSPANSKIPVGSTISRPEGVFVKTATGWVSKASNTPVIPGKSKALDAQMISTLQKRGLSESRKPVHVKFVKRKR